MDASALSGLSPPKMPKRVSLSDSDKAAVFKRINDGARYKEIVKELGISVNQIDRIKKKLSA